MNLTNYEKTPMFRVFEIVKREAARYGVAILESEIIGLVPRPRCSPPRNPTCRSRVHAVAGAREPLTRVGSVADNRNQRRVRFAECSIARPESTDRLRAKAA